MVTERSGMPFSTTSFSIRASVGQAWTQAPQETHSESRKLSSSVPALIIDAKPRPSTVSAKVPWVSLQARTQREQTMQREASKSKYGLESSTAAI